jgi:hypothetical protein
MPSRKEVLEELDDDLKEVLTDIDATKKWTDTVMRVADALEHLSMGSTINGLTMMGFKIKNTPSAKHRGLCPNCALIKNAEAPSPVDIVNAHVPIIGQGRKG